MLKAGVIGAGFMGELHCKTYAALADVVFTGIYDADGARAAEMAAKYMTKSFSSSEELLSGSDIVSIATPTVYHYKTALLAAEKGVHMLIEKPITANIEEAEDLINKIEKKGLTAAVGYIERFNPCVTELMRLLKDKKVLSVRTVRLAPPAQRANDVSVVIDLMLHDLDIVLNIAGQDAKVVSARGQKRDSSVLNDVRAELFFGNGIKAELISNKVADEKSRTVAVKCGDCTIEADLIKRKIMVKLRDGSNELIKAEGEEPIKAEILDFIGSVAGKRKPLVSAKDSLLSFRLACEIEKKAALS